MSSTPLPPLRRAATPMFDRVLTVLLAVTITVLVVLTLVHSA
jgi:hypothetical protein